MQQVKPRYQPRKTDEGWRIMWIFPDGYEEPVEEPYPVRQNAYRRAKQLNETNNKPYVLYVQMQVQRPDCPTVKEWIKKNIGGYAVFVLDPLRDYDPDLRFVRFGVQVRYKADDRDPDLLSYDDVPMLQDELMEKIGRLRAECPVRELDVSHHSYKEV